MKSTIRQAYKRSSGIDQRVVERALTVANKKLVEIVKDVKAHALDGLPKNLLTLAFVVLLASPAQSEETVVPSADAFAYCAALAQAGAEHQQNIMKNKDTAQAMAMVANGYATAALIKAAQTMNAPQAYVEKLVLERKAHYASQLTMVIDVPAVKFKSDAEACKQIEPYAYQLIADYTKQHAQPAQPAPAE